MTTTKAAKKPTKKSRNEEKASKNLTLMVIVSAFLYIFGNVPNSLAFIIAQYVPVNTDFMTVVYIVANSLLFTTQGMDIFVYYFFNYKYNAILNNLIKRVFAIKE
jgi:hypothetical protein